MTTGKNCPDTPPKPKDCESQKLVEHLTSAHKYKEVMIETHFDNQILQAYFTDELLGMKTFDIFPILPSLGKLRIITCAV